MESETVTSDPRSARTKAFRAGSAGSLPNTLSIEHSSAIAPRAVAMIGSSRCPRKSQRKTYSRISVRDGLLSSFVNWIPASANGRSTRNSAPGTLALSRNAIEVLSSRVGSAFEAASATKRVTLLWSGRRGQEFARRTSWPR